MIVKNAEGKTDQPAEGVTRKVLSYGGKMMAVEFFFEQGAVGAVHSHPHEQVGYIVSGAFEVEMNGEKTMLRPGDTYYVPPDTPHGVVALEAGTVYDVFTPQREDLL